MSIFFDFDVGCKGRRFRRAVDQDKKDIELFWDRELTKDLFREDDIGSLIELSNLSICMINGKMEVIGFMALSDHPSASGVDPGDWETWICNLFQYNMKVQSVFHRRRFLPRQTLFINFMCCEDSVTEYFVEEALNTVFLNDVYLQQIILLVPPGCPDEVLMRYQTFKRRNFSRYFSREDEYHNFHCLMVAMDKDFSPALKCRRAAEEDNDDIVEILESKCKELKDLYGEFYVSEIIGRRPENNRQFIVAQLNDKVVGVMCLNSDVNLENLQSIYELNGYYGLVKAPPFEKEVMNRKNTLLQQFGDPIMLGKWSPYETVPDRETSPFEDDTAGFAASKEELNLQIESKVGRVIFNSSGAVNQSDTYQQRYLDRSDSDDSLLSLRRMSSGSVSEHDVGISITCLLDEDPFDYEIVNIDKNLIHEMAVNFSSLEINTKSVKSFNRGSTQYQNRRRRSSMKFEENVPVFKGTPNAFVIELFGLKDNIDDRLAFFLLSAAFECMCCYDYCVIRVRTKAKSFALLQHFSLVPTRPTVCCEYALYVAHRNSITGHLRVRLAEFADIPRIAIVLNNLDAKDTIYTVEHNIGKKHSNNAYVLVCDHTVIGLAILGQPEQVDYVRTKFSVDTHLVHRYHVAGQGLNNGFMTLKTLLMFPVFEPHYRFFARELMRKSGTSVIMWFTAYRNKMVVNKANSIVSHMIPVMPLRANLCHLLFTEYRKKEFQANKNTMAFSTWFISNKYTSIQKINIDTRIVIVGASQTAMAFINDLLFSDSSVYLNFTHVTFVSPNGLPYLRHSFPAAETMFPKNNASADKYLKCVPYTYYVNVIHGTMIEINKQEQYIKLENGQKIFFDLLFLLLGKQYQHPNYMEDLLQHDKLSQSDNPPPYITLDVPRYIETEPHNTYYDTPDNVFIINSITEASKALHYVMCVFTTLREQYPSIAPVIVYGATLEAYCCISALLEINVPPRSIVFVEPFPPEDEKEPRVPFFSNVYVDETVKQVLDSIGIKTYRGHYFSRWSEIENIAVEVEFLSDLKAVTLNCCAFFYYGKRGINSQAFAAINRCGIAYDGGILIDHTFRTNTPSIYSAGPVTRYYRRYYANSSCQKYYNAAEIGQKLAAQIRNQLDPLFKERNDTTHQCFHCVSKEEISSSSSESTKSRPVTAHIFYSNNASEHGYTWRLPDLKKPLVWYCTLPGGMNYLEVRPPGMKVPHYYVQSLSYNGFILETFKKGYFKLHFTMDFVLNGITCLTPETYNLEAFKHLYGLSAVTLNNVHYRYTAKKVNDFFEFFLSPWAIFLYHDHIEDFMASVKELFPKGQTKGKTLEEGLRKVANKQDNKLSLTDAKENMRGNFEKSPHFEAIMDYVMHWLDDNDVLLPMYLEPNRLLEYSYDLARHPAFRKRKISAQEIVKSINQ